MFYYTFLQRTCVNQDIPHLPLQVSTKLWSRLQKENYLKLSLSKTLSKTRFFSSSREIEERLLMKCLRKQDEIDDEEKV